MGGAIIDLTGQTYGRLTVIRRDGSKYGRPAWLCRCTCGSHKIIAAKNLRNGNTTSCGCYQREVVTATVLSRAETLTGQRFDRLTVIERGDKPQHWICRCDCGNVTDVDARHLRDGHTRSCGCISSEWTIANNKARRLKVVRYYSAHSRVQRGNGPASNYRCVDCGNQAKDWSYDHSDPEEVQDERGIFYSMKETHYVPRCVPCHRKHDRQQTKRRKALIP